MDTAEVTKEKITRSDFISDAGLSREARSRRLWFFSLTFLTASFATTLLLDILGANGLSTIELVALPLSFVLFTWISGAFWTSVAGFVVRLVGRDAASLDPKKVKDNVLRGRTAVVMCVYNEDVSCVSAGVNAIWKSLTARPEAQAFDFFILSDTRNPEIAAAEEAAWRTLVARHDADGRLFYRRRAENIGRKAGNIADFVRNWGAAYEYMVVLDADSIMSGEALVTLARLMEAHPRTGIIQTVPAPAGRSTLFARMIQFASRLNGPVLSSGLAYWQLGESNYWGHNAIIRLRPFASHCALPHLPGREPLGGEILSHDFVEAAFMRRAGYEVWLMPQLEGSWEQVPTNVIDFAARDKRWAQGNLQHLRVLPMAGLHWLTRIHLLTGVLAYLTSPIWLGVLVLSTLATCLDAVQGHQYFAAGVYTLFPNWPEYRGEQIASLLMVTLALLFVPKLLGAALALKNRRSRAAFGGGRRLAASLLVEQIFSMLLAPVMMLMHSIFVACILAGKSVTWNSQARSDRGLSFRETALRHRWHFAVGLIWVAIIVTVAPKFIWWMLPVLTGLLLAVPLVMCTSRRDLGQAFRRAGLLLTPEETSTPVELAGAEQSLDGLTASTSTEEPVRVPLFTPLRMEPEPVVYIGRGKVATPGTVQTLPGMRYNPVPVPEIQIQ